MGLVACFVLCAQCLGFKGMPLFCFMVVHLVHLIVVVTQSLVVVLVVGLFVGLVGRLVVGSVGLLFRFVGRWVFLRIFRRVVLFRSI